MMNEINNAEDAVVLVQLRNQFYRKKFYFLLSIFVLSLVVLGVLIGVLVHLIKNPTRPIYFVADNVGRLMYEVPLGQPNMSLDDVEAWTIEAVESAFTYNYISYRAQLQDTQKYFTLYGWQQFMKGLVASNNLLGLQQRRMIFIAKVVGKPKLIVEGLLGGAYSYKFEMPVLYTFLYPPYDNSYKSRINNALKVSVIVQRQKILSSYKGLGILQIIAGAPTPISTDTMTSTPASQQ